MSGNGTVDKLSMELLINHILNWKHQKNSIFICKLFNPNIDFLVSQKHLFKAYKFFKPEASRKDSSEIYFIGKFA